MSAVVICRAAWPERGGAEVPRVAPPLGGSTLSDFNPVERGFSRAICPDAFFDGRQLAASGFADRAGKLKVQLPISFLGSARVQPSKQSPRCIAYFLHNQAPSAGELHLHLTTGASACPNQGGAYPHPNGATP